MFLLEGLFAIFRDHIPLISSFTLLCHGVLCFKNLPTKRTRRPKCVPRPQAGGPSSAGSDVSNSAVAANDVPHTAADHAGALPLRGPWRPTAKLPPRALKCRAPPPKHLSVVPEEAHR